MSEDKTIILVKKSQKNPKTRSEKRSEETHDKNSEKRSEKNSEAVKRFPPESKSRESSRRMNQRPPNSGFGGNCAAYRWGIMSAKVDDDEHKDDLKQNAQAERVSKTSLLQGVGSVIVIMIIIAVFMILLGGC